MAENLYTRFRSSVNVAYTAGSGTLVAFDSFAGKSPNFTVGVYSQTTRVLKSLLTVTGVSTVTLTVTAEDGIDANCSVGDIIAIVQGKRSLAAILPAPAGSGSEYQYRASASSFGAVTNSGPIPTASWVLHNAGGAAGIGALDDFSARGINLHLSGNVTDNEWVLASQTLGSAPYTLIAQIKMSMIGGVGANIVAGGIALYDGTKLYFFGLIQTNGVQLEIATGQLSTITSAPTYANTTANVVGTQVTLKIVDDGVHRTFYYWSNGSFTQLFQETTATFLTPNAVGIVGKNGLAAANDLDIELKYWSIS